MSARYPAKLPKNECDGANCPKPDLEYSKIQIHNRIIGTPSPTSDRLSLEPIVKLGISRRQLLIETTLVQVVQLTSAKVGVDVTAIGSPGNRIRKGWGRTWRRLVGVDDAVSGGEGEQRRCSEEDGEELHF